MGRLEAEFGQSQPVVKGLLVGVVKAAEEMLVVEVDSLQRFQLDQESSSRLERLEKLRK